uniref:Corticotropin-releasing factor-binding protein n=1 Tax=Tetraodon nigroviridis TaxID=99883 RepID=H3DD54_TETNG
MSLSARTQLLLFLISLLSIVGRSRFIEEDDDSDGLYSLLNMDQKRQSADFIFRRPLRCLDMLATDGYFTFVASQPQLACAAFVIAEPDEVISLELQDVSIDCTAGDFIKIFDGWVLKGEKFPSRQDHPLPLHQRYTDYCSSEGAGATSRSSQNVAMVFFRVHGPGSGFTLAVKKLHNPFPCNIMSQSPEGSFTMVIPHQRRNCSFSIIYPVEIRLTALSLGQAKSNDIGLQRQVWSDCSGSGDYVELLGGDGVDTSQMFPVADLCFSLSGLAQMKIGCDNSVVRLVSAATTSTACPFSTDCWSSTSSPGAERTVCLTSAL